MNLYSQQNLWLLLILIPAVLLLTRLETRRLRRFTRFAEPQFASEYLRRLSPFYLTLKLVLALLGLVFLIFALARPQWDVETRELSSQGLDIMICLDISKSMDAQDMTPSRLLRAKLQTKSFIDRLKGDRVGIIAFAGKATLECPLTDDYESVALVLSSLETDSAVQLGTDIGAAMALAEKSFLSSGGNNVLLLVSDGEDLGGSSLQQAQRLASAGARVYTLGVGSAEGVTITDPETGRSTFSRLDARNLEKLASAGKGRYYAVTPGQNELDLILQNIYAEEKGRERSKSISTYKEQYHIPAFLSLAFLLLESLILPLRGRRKQA